MTGIILSQLDAEAKVGALRVGASLECGELRIERVASPFGPDDGPRYAVYRNGKRMRIGARGDTLFTLSEAASSYRSDANWGK